ncbi:unnamed protein product [Enterobius vermicularis]|uniref:Ketoacyl_synth_N domain-containing protein n=1 Tax=Enterobius vermicularis TaxID=51028 RepID=A0A0N4VF78_ENTVE|nr:unnamed protein product [Enterobius vermicularis]
MINSCAVENIDGRQQTAGGQNFIRPPKYAALSDACYIAELVENRKPDQEELESCNIKLVGKCVNTLAAEEMG